jgi:hypothetical protein
MSFRRTALIATATVAVGASLLAAPLAAASTSTGRGDATNNGQTDRQDGFSVGVWGDMPYIKGKITKDLALAGIDKVVADINKESPLFTVFDGDIKAGSKSFCGTDAKTGYNPYDNAKKMFAAVTPPTVYTPGDNEWTDCDRPSNGGLKPNDQLAYIRANFFATPFSQGTNPMPVEQQSAAYPENARWVHDGITFITINVPGTDNNAPQFSGTDMLDPDGNVTTDPAKQNGDLVEYTARNAANLAWLEDGFRYAQTHGSKGIMIVQQGDMWATNGDVTTHYAAEKTKLAELVSGTNRQVLLVNGDSHVYAPDQPLSDANGNVVPNFQRLTTDGEGKVGWTEVKITPNDKQVFSFEQHLLDELPV